MLRAQANLPMHYTLLAIGIFIALAAAMLLFLEVGRRIGVRKMATDPEGAKAGLGPVVGVVFSLLGLLLAFTFSGGASRFDARKELAVKEVNALSRAYYLLGLLPETAQASLQESFRRCLDAELAAMRALPDVRTAKRAFSQSSALKLEIRNQVLRLYQNTDARAAAATLLPAINEWIENATVRMVAANTHPPRVIYIVLISLALVSSLVAGYGMAEAKSRSWLHILVFATVIAGTIYVIIDLEYPRVGLIQLRAADRLLEETRRKMGG